MNHLCRFSLAGLLWVGGASLHAQAIPKVLGEALLHAPAGASRTPSGLASEIQQAGQGKVQPGARDYVTLNYTIWDRDGERFENTLENGGPLTLCVNRILKGMNEGVRLMVEGERRRLWIPAALGFQGSKGPKGDLVVDLELLSLFPQPDLAPPDLAHPPEDAQLLPSGLVYRVLRKGTGQKHPRRYDKVSVHYTGWTADGKMFDSSLPKEDPATFRLDEVIKGWTQGVQMMVEGDRMRFWIPQNLAYQGEKGMPAGALVFDVELMRIWH